MELIRKTASALITRPIGWVLILALAMRLIPVGYGLPLFLVNDEPAFVLGALKMLELKTLVPAWHEAEFRTVLAYPPLLSYFYLILLAPVLAAHYLLAGAPPLAEYHDSVAVSPSFIWVLARMLNALMAVAIIAVTYAISRRVTGSERASFLAAVALALSFYHLQLSHVVRHWTPAALLVYAAWLSSLGIPTGGGWRPYLRTGLFAGLAMGVNTSGAIALLPAAIQHLALGRGPWWRRMTSARAWAMAALALAILAAVIALYPYGFTRGEGGATVGGDLGMRFSALGSRSVSAWLRFLAGYASLLVTYEPALLAAAAVGLLLLIRRAPRFVMTVAVFSILYLTALYLFFNAIPRALIFLLPALAIAAGYAMDRVLLMLQNRCPASAAGLAAAYVVVGLVAFALPAAVAARYLVLAARPDTRLVAKAWIESNVPPGSHVLMDTQYLRLPNTQDGVRELERLDPSALRAPDRAALRRGEAPPPAFHVLNLHFLNPSVPARAISDSGYFRRLGFAYLVVERERADASDLVPATRSLAGGLKPIARFTPRSGGDGDGLDISGEIANVPLGELFRIQRFGQIVEVYRL